MGVRKSKEPDLERARAIAEDGCILRAVVGSTVHGLSNPGTDDRDEMGVYQGIELITCGRISLPVPEPARAHLMAVRRGELPLVQVVADLHEKTSELEQAVLRSSLPEGADRAAVDSFLIRAYERSWARS